MTQAVLDSYLELLRRSTVKDKNYPVGAVALTLREIKAQARRDTRLSEDERRAVLEKIAWYEEMLRA